MTVQVEGSAAPVSARRVYVHIGTPKSGTTYLQRILSGNAALLRERGFVYPLPRREAMFHAAVDVVGAYDAWGMDRGQTEGIWGRLCQEIQESGLNGIISHEILSAATPAQIEAAVEHLAGLEIHVLLTARDMGRQITAGWQEGIKNGERRTFAEFQERVMAGVETGRPTAPFWRLQDVGAILERWSEVTEPERVHVITAPPPGAPRNELWQRFAGAIGLDPEAYDLESNGSGNESLGPAQVALLREVNDSLDGGIPQPLYEHVVKRMFAQRILRNFPSGRLTYPAVLYEPLLGLAQHWTESIKRAGFTVHGDLVDLTPLPPDPDAPHPDDVSVEEKYQVSLGVITELLIEIARQRGAPHPPPPPPPSLVRRAVRKARRILTRSS